MSIFPSLFKQYKKLFALENIDFDMDKEAIEFVVEKALEYKLGARGLRSICEAIINDAMYELPSQNEVKKFVVTRAYAEEQISKSKMAEKLRVA